MFLTLYYVYATMLQWWRLGVLQNKLRGTLTSQNALLVATGNVISDKKHRRCLENLLFSNENRIGCTIVPKQNINLTHFAQLPKTSNCLPLHINRSNNVHLDKPHIHLLITSHLQNYVPHRCDIVQIENYGELIGWKAIDEFELIIKTDLNHLTKLVYYYFNHNLDINHDMQLIKIETIDVDGQPSKIRYEKKYDYEQQFRYSRSPNKWDTFVKEMKVIYSKINETSTITPKITIENGNKLDDSKKVPISEVKPIKKENKKLQEKNENRLEVDIRKHKERKEHKSTHRSKEREHKDTSKCTAPDVSIVTSKKEGKLKDDVKIKSASSTCASGGGSSSKTRQTTTKESKDEHKHRNKDDVKEKTKELSMDAAQKRQVFKQSSGDKKTDSKSKEQDNCTQVDVVDSKTNNCVMTANSTTAANETTTITNTSSSNITNTTADTSTKSNNIDKSLSEKSETVKKEDKIFKDSLTVAGGTTNKPFKKPITCAIANGSTVNCIKPPNVLVYADSLVAKDNVKNVLNTILNREKYTIYDLPANSSTHLWNNTTTLVVVCGSVTETVTKELLQFLVSGGQLLCLCSDLLHEVLKTFATAEVREHELVRFTYGEWKRVKMMHHIFCYQASPAKKQFSKDSDHSHSSNGSSPIAPRTPSIVEIQHGGNNYTIQVQVLGTEETWETPSLLLACVKNTRGRAIFSQVHLEIDPTEYQDDENKYAALKDSNQARLEILKDILSKHLEMDCNNVSHDVKYAPGYFLGRHDCKLKLLKDYVNHVTNETVLELDKITLMFYGKNVVPDSATFNKLPILIHSCPSNFSTFQYFESLQTEHIGRLVIYTDVMTSSQLIIAKKTFEHGFVVIPRQQTDGIGRSNNSWLSPLGCAMFSLQMHVPLRSIFGKSLSLIQHFVMVSIVHSIKKRPGYENLEIGIKWPNDLYAYSGIKIGGLLVTSQLESDLAIVNIGCGINLNNNNPTTCINDVIKRYNDQNKTELKLIGYEGFFAMIFNEIETLYNGVQNGQTDYLFDLYYKYWLHSNAEIKVTTSDGNIKDVEIIGVDEYGYLKVKSKDGVTSSVQPDGNSFDMLKGLIAPKLF